MCRIQWIYEEYLSKIQHHGAIDKECSIVAEVDFCCSRPDSDFCSDNMEIIDVNHGK